MSPAVFSHGFTSKRCN